ncbi:MAG: PspA/IM30 family protein, partial [Dehalococcoidia bacterium]|nr:PspA/IM30 family protein [Dehalococcoidia bacterium]
MASIFRRMFKVAESNAHAAMDSLEDPIKMTEQGIRDLKKNLQAAMVSLAQVKSLAIRMQKETSDHKKRAADYERKAMLILKKMEAGEMEAGEAERLATAALEKKEEEVQQTATANTDHQTQQRMAD